MTKETTISNEAQRRKRKPRGKARPLTRAQAEQLARPDLDSADRLAKRIGGNVRAMWEAKVER